MEKVKKGKRRSECEDYDSEEAGTEKFGGDSSRLISNFFCIGNRFTDRSKFQSLINIDAAVITAVHANFILVVLNFHLIRRLLQRQELLHVFLSKTRTRTKFFVST